MSPRNRTQRSAAVGGKQEGAAYRHNTLTTQDSQNIGHARHRRTAFKHSPDHAVSPLIDNLALVLENNAVETRFLRTFAAPCHRSQVTGRRWLLLAISSVRHATCAMRHGKVRREFERRRTQRLSVLLPSVPAKQTDHRTVRMRRET